METGGGRSQQVGVQGAEAGTNPVSWQPAEHHGAPRSPGTVLQLEDGTVVRHRDHLRNEQCRAPAQISQPRRLGQQRLRPADGQDPADAQGEDRPGVGSNPVGAVQTGRHPVHPSPQTEACQG